MRPEKPSAASIGPAFLKRALERREKRYRFTAHMRRPTPTARTRPPTAAPPSTEAGTLRHAWMLGVAVDRLVVALLVEACVKNDRLEVARPMLKVEKPSR